ncbi:MAG: precorrin-2 C(20)-methyltransferase [Nitrospinaceae bacterium]|mgnify:CR=1 FL=1|jgi:precorrin-2/cobalt-factor-2 C20-methyltransferase|nr:precorrin-2 C(20)-methyltransferase [Nitrospinaceae bacterium]MBT3432930.1 precorrin-2 C(20)-methyltransferase [Nitrospinaceae bacterium]MBT3820737.1 precorrin-2 C(20)-methyltransferase [Nitrospinaceae bacterium]MBT4431618.1 precorrin-2 C(20)-methyltransferase [Nitrospinaceae bacterium]MBT5368697.1 precorrin-2 C(20)-methyltransferase [Nitrospinaceae bacterium]
MASSTSNGNGTLYGIGIGPGDPELITLKAHRLIAATRIIAYPAPDEGDSFTREIVAPYLDGMDKEEILIRMPMRTDRFPAQEVYDRTRDDLASHLEAGRDVAYLCQGDPFFYGSFMYLYSRMAEDFNIEIVPGVSSIMAGGAALGAPLASRNDTLTILPGPIDAAELKSRLLATDAAVIIKVGKHFGKIREVLTECGLLDNARYIERATLKTERILKLDEVASDDEVPYFSMILVHKRGAAWKI